MATQPKPQATEEGFVAFDYGTSVSRIAYVKGKGAGLVTDLAGDAGFPSVLAMSEKGGFLAGGAAKDRQSLYPLETIFSIKSLLTTDLKTIKAQGMLYPFADEQAEGNVAQVTIGGRKTSVVEINAMYLAWLRRSAEIRLERPVRLGVITIPTCLSPFDRQCLKLAGRLAGFQRVRLIEESTAAALAWAAEGGRGRLAVCTWGAGYFNSSIMEVQDQFVRILATKGTSLGGDYVDLQIARDFLEKIKTSGLKIENEANVARHVLVAAEAAKCDLANRGKAEISIKLAGSSKVIKQAYTIKDLEKWIEPLKENSSRLIHSLIASLPRGVDTKLDALVLTGGMMHIKPLTSHLEKLFEIKANKSKSHNLEDDAVLGALVRARLLDREQSDLVVLDKLYSGLGLENQDGSVSTILERGVPIPASSTEQFTTFLDKQTDMAINLFGQKGATWQPLGQVVISKIPPLKAGEAAIELRIIVDEDGVVTATAIEITKKKQLVAELLPLRGLPMSIVNKTLEACAKPNDENFVSEVQGELQQRGRFLLESLQDIIRRRVGIMTRDERQLIEKRSKDLSEVLEGADLMEMRDCVQELEEAARPMLQRDIDASLQSIMG